MQNIRSYVKGADQITDNVEKHTQINGMKVKDETISHEKPNPTTRREKYIFSWRVLEKNSAHT